MNLIIDTTTDSIVFNPLSAQGQWVNHRFGKREPTGNHGHVRAKRFSDYITVYPDRSITGSWNDEPVARLHIRNGRIESFTVTTQGDLQW